MDITAWLARQLERLFDDLSDEETKPKKQITLQYTFTNRKYFKVVGSPMKL